jgi:hypothetical protein
MRKTSPLLLAVLAAACAPDQDGATMDAAQLTAPLFEVRGDHFRTHATGSEEVPANPSLAQGQAMFQLSDDGTTLSYKLIVANIENVLQSHIHLAPAGSNGGIVVWLYPSAPPAQLIPGRSQGVLAEGEITSANFVNALAGQSMDVLLGHLRSGNAYVNVHTTQFPPGEIRGQVR